MTRNKLICDTNVWYEIASKRIDTSQINDLLFGTHITCSELASTQRLISNLPFIKDVVTALKQNHYKIILPNPAEHILSIFFHDFIPDVSGSTKILEAFDILINLDTTSIPLEKIEMVQNQIDNIVNPLQNFSNRLNDGLIIIRERVLQQEGRKKHQNADHLIYWKEYISDFVKNYSLEYCEREYIINPNDANWIQLTCFIGVWEKYFKLLESENRKFDRNDWADLFNLVYVQPGFKYWTFENKWKNIIRNDHNLKHYFFEQNGS
jgi:hypothetical protein